MKCWLLLLKYAFFNAVKVFVGLSPPTGTHIDKIGLHDRTVNKIMAGLVYSMHLKKSE